MSAVRSLAAVGQKANHVEVAETEPFGTLPVSLDIMKTSRLLLAAVATLGLGVATHAAPEKASDTPTVVNFFEPENFTDVRDTEMGNYERTAYLDMLRDHLRKRASNYVPPGYTLKVTFTDIDMAGEFEPWRGPRFSDIRIVKDIYPPRIELSFQLTDPQGNVVKEGKRELRDLAFLMKISGGFRDDPVRHEKALLDDWLRDEFTRVNN